MIDRRELLLLATASAAAAAAPAASAAPAKARGSVRPSRASEIRALRKFAETTHPRGREARDDSGWQKRWAKLERVANALGDGPYFVEARYALAWFEDGHSTVLPFEYLGKIPDAFAKGPFGSSLPWKVRLFDDGAYVTALRERSPMLGLKIKQVGSLETGQLLRKLSDTWPGNRAWAQNWAASTFTSPAQLHGLGAISGPLSPVPVVVSDAMRTIDFRLVPERGEVAGLSDIERKRTEREAWAATIGRGNYVKPLPDRRALYLSIDDMDDVEGTTFEQLTKDAFEAMESPAAERLVVDLRRNGGGNNLLGEALRKHIERSRFNFPGRLYVLTGPATFSAAQNLANRLERETFAIFVGGPTGLSPNHYGDAKIFTGPVTGLTAMVSTLPWFDSYPQDKREWILPDLPVPATFADWRDGRDPALDLAFTHRATGAAEDWSGDRVFYYRRDSQKADWKPFWA